MSGCDASAGRGRAKGKTPRRAAAIAPPPVPSSLRRDTVSAGNTLVDLMLVSLTTEGTLPRRDNKPEGR